MYIVIISNFSNKIIININKNKNYIQLYFYKKILKFIIFSTFDKFIFFIFLLLIFITY